MIDKFGETLNQNKKEYAKRHNYDIYFGTNDVYPFSTSPCWSKFYYNLKKLDEGYTTILNVDSDTKIMNHNKTIEQLDKAARDLCGDYSVAVAKDINGFNCGVYMLKNNPKTYEILQTSLTLINSTEIKRMRFNEQSALSYVASHNRTLNSSICVVPMRLLNSYPPCEGWAGYVYQPGDFLLHFVNTGKRHIQEYF